MTPAVLAAGAAEAVRGDDARSGVRRDLTADYIRTLHLQTPIAIAASATALVIVTAMFFDSVPRTTLWGGVRGGPRLGPQAVRGEGWPRALNGEI